MRRSIRTTRGRHAQAVYHHLELFPRINTGRDRQLLELIRNW